MNENQAIEIRLAANQFINEKKYWTGELSGELSFSSFPGDKDKKEKNFCRDVFSARIDGKLFERLTQMSGGANTNLHIILAAAVIALSERYTGIRDIIIGTAVDRQESTGKLFNTILPLRIRLDENITFKQLIIQAKKKMDQAIENQNYPIEYLVYEDLRMKKPANGFALFDTGILLKNIQEKKYIDYLNVNILFTFLKTGECLECEIDYNSAYYTCAAVERIFTHLVQFLAAAVFNVDREIAEMEILTENEKHQLLHEFNRTQRAYPDSKTIHVLFEDRVASGPHHTAIVYRDEHYSYTHINEKANQLARLLVSRGIRTDEPAALLLDRSPVMAECILAVWKAGGAYIPLDTQYPLQRITDILSNSRAKVMLSLRSHIYQALETAYKDMIIPLDTAKEEIARQNPGNLNIENIEIDMKGLAYIIYTSGSTGKPKGAMVEHRGMINHIYAKINALQISGNSILVQNASHTFDVSVWQFFIALTQGGRTIIYPVDYIFDVGMFINQTIKNQVTVLEVVPSYLAAMLDANDFGTGKFKSLEYILVTGETVPPGLVVRWFEKQPGIKMINAYGPTEASDDITHFIMDKAPGLARIPVGKPVQNLHIYIVNEKMKLCPIGVKGEICVSGVGVGRGYINDDQVTAKVFMTDPFAEQDPEGTRLYKTGDIGCWLPDGNIDFFGRKDYQVKLRGFRIELGEIENALNAFPGIKNTAVVDKVYKDGNKYLCAYFVSEGELDIPGIKKYLAEKLPYYMIPAHFNALKELPLTPNGKIDRLALQNLELEKESSMPFITAEVLERSVSLTSLPSIKPGEMSGAEAAGVAETVETIETFNLTPEEREQVLELFNNTGVDYEKHKTIHQVFEEQAARTPENMAVKFEHNQLTYAELNKRANRLAGVLRTQGVKAGNIVGLMVERSLEMLTGLLAILKAGGAYLPIGAENPGERIQFILDDCRAGMVLMDPGKSPAFQNYNGKFLDINREAIAGGDVSNLAPACEPADLAYVIYTSGTTGTPKGVMIENRAIINFRKGITDIIEFNEYSVILSLITVSFDIFVLETIVPLTRGSRVVIGNKDAQANAAVTGKLLKKENITAFQCTPTMLQRILSDEEAAAGLQRLQYLLVGGEIFREALLVKALAKTNGKIFNLYGPTETTVWSTVKQVTGPGTLNIGKPIANTQVYILNEQRELCPIGVSGELCIGGDGVARGYLNRPELTAEKFKKHRSYKSNRSYISFYKTGDLARWLADGDLEFLGRQDHQIKINGIRIELEEIESILSQHPDIGEAAVVVKEKTGGNPILCAYLVSQKRLVESEIRSYLAGKIPAYMIPNQFVQLEKMPLTPSGKADRKLLAAVEIAADENYAAPRNDTERKLKEIWETTLGTGNIGIKDNFFNIGGDSIKSINLVNQLNREFHRDLKIRDLFQNETIEKLAEKIGKPDTDTGTTQSTESSGSSESTESKAQYDQALQELEAVKNKFMKRKAN